MFARWKKKIPHKSYQFMKNGEIDISQLFKLKNQKKKKNLIWHKAKAGWIGWSCKKEHVATIVTQKPLYDFNKRIHILRFRFAKSQTC